MSNSEPEKNQPRSKAPRIVIEFDDNHVAKFDLSGTINAYMLKGAAGILDWQAGNMMQDAVTQQRDIAIVRGMPGIPKPT